MKYNTKLKLFYFIHRHFNRLKYLKFFDEVWDRSEELPKISKKENDYYDKLK